MITPNQAVQAIQPGTFEVDRHFYTRVPNAQLHPLVRAFLGLGNDRIARRYSHLHPEISREAITEALSYRPRFFRWSGSDLFHVTNEDGRRRMVIIETNSSPSGQKSMPLVSEEQEQAGYRRLLEQAFVPALARRGLPAGGLAVLWDKNPMETTGYAAVLADLTNEPVYLVHFPADDPDPSARFVDGILQVRVDGEWRPIRAAFRYVTQRPWSRIPPITRTLLFNPVVTCLAGGRNKMLAAKAYDVYNGESAASRMHIHVPETIWDVGHDEVPLWVNRMGGVAVVKNPYSNAGQGVYTITSPTELEAFMSSEQRYDRFIVQGLIGNLNWSSRTRQGRLYHVGTLPDRRCAIYVADVRMMIGAGPSGFFPVSLYARRARRPLTENADDGSTSWDMLGTNLSVKNEDGSWTTESERLMLMDNRDFNRLGLGLDDLIEGYLQSVQATIAIDRMAVRLVTQKGRFRRKFFRSVNPDDALIEDIC